MFPRDCSGNMKVAEDFARDLVERAKTHPALFDMIVKDVRLRASAGRLCRPFRFVCSLRSRHAQGVPWRERLSCWEYMDVVRRLPRIRN